MTSRQRKWVLVSGVVGVFALAAAWGIGRYQGIQETRAVEKELESLQPELDRLKRLEARRQLELTLDALDQRNFGIAQEHLVAAARRLKGSDPAPESELHALAEEIANTNLVAADDFADQRHMIQDYIRRLDKGVPRRAPVGEKKKTPEEAPSKDEAPN